MKKYLRLSFIILICIELVFLLQNISLAWNAKTDGIDEVDNWIDLVTDDGGVSATTQRVVGTAINVIRIVGTGIAIIMLTYVAIKYMSAAPSEKAEFKKSATAMIVGAIVLFAATNILGVIAKFADKNIT